MRKAFKDYDECAHVWAQQRQSEGYTSERRMYFHDSKIYSYGSHFCIARMLSTGTVLFTYRNYSPTTSKHKQAVMSAVRGRRIVYCRNPDDYGPREERERVVREIAELLEQAEHRPRIRQTTRDKLRASALFWAKRFNTYLEAVLEANGDYGFKIDDVQRIDVNNLPGVTEEVRRSIAEAEERRRRVVEERKRVECENLAKWRVHDPDMEYAHFYNIADALRLSKDGQEVQTSRGASIPVNHAKRLWPIIENTRAVGKELERDFRLGHYTLKKVRADGSIVVGCHDIPYSEIEGIARDLGLINQGEPA